MFADSPAIQSRDDELLLSDGIRLISKLWFPEAGGPWPALLMRQPYGRHIASTVTYAHPSWWAQHGFLVVVQDVRGQGDSTGVFSGFSQEASDTAATHAWVRALPECNGKLGCYGFSYQGLTQLLAPANAQPPDCFAPAMAGLDERDNWSCEGGAHWWHLGLGWGLQLAALQAKRRGDAEAWIKIRRSLENGTYLRDGPALLKEHDPKGMAWTWLQRDPRDREQWPIHPVQSSWLQQPMLLLGGWWDPHLLGLLDLWQQSKAAGGSPKLMVGPATHLEWWPDAQTQLLQFFSQHLKGIDNWPSAKRAQFWNITQSCWQEACTPPASTWSLQSCGLACTDPTHGVLQSDGLGMGMEWIVHDPWRPMPAIGGHLSPSAGPADRATLDRRTDVATFNTSPLTTDLQLFGRPQLSVMAQADHPGFDLYDNLSRCTEGGDRAEQLSTGVLRVLGNKAQMALEHVVQLQPLLATLEVGDQLRLSIAAAAWPAVGVNPGDDTTPSGAPSPQHRVVTLTLHLTDSKLQLIPMNSGKLAGE